MDRSGIWSGVFCRFLWKLFAFVHITLQKKTFLPFGLDALFSKCSKSPRKKYLVRSFCWPDCVSISRYEWLSDVGHQFLQLRNSFFCFLYFCFNFFFDFSFFCFFLRCFFLGWKSNSFFYFIYFSILSFDVVVVVVLIVTGCKRISMVESRERYSRGFSIRVCREGFWTLTLFKD